MAFKKPTNDELEHRYLYHPPKGNQGDRYEMIRTECCKLAKKIVEHSPASAEQVRALNALDEAMMLTNAAIARNE